MKDINDYLEEASQELFEKTPEEIHVDSSLRSAARAFVSYRTSLGFSAASSRLGWFVAAEEFRTKALAEAASIDNAQLSSELIGTVRDIVDEIRDRAIESAGTDSVDPDVELESQESQKNEDATTEDDDTLEIENV